MSQSQVASVPTPPSVEIDPLTYDFQVEEAVYQRERERLVRDHLGKFAVICGKDFAGVFDSFAEAITEGMRRFGLMPMMIRDITAEEEDSIYFPHVDVNDPSFRRLDR